MDGTRPSLTLILGGARSGKSTYAEALAGQLGERVLYVATAEALDGEMRARVAAHQARRPRAWTTLETPLDVGATLRQSPEAAEADAVLLDCLTLLVSNIVLSSSGDGESRDLPELDLEAARSQVEAEIESLLAAHRELEVHLVIVSNEVGLGLVPPYPLGRIYRDCLGWANQALAQVADRVILMVAGLPVDLKALPLAWPGGQAHAWQED
jgi:adenosylcobinamide kinase / adenosylcobinamide-phosphate guanylyltransferase